MGTRLAALSAAFAAAPSVAQISLAAGGSAAGSSSARSLAEIIPERYTAKAFCADDQGYNATAEEEYWLRKWPEFCSSSSSIHSVKWLPHFLDEQGGLNICIRLQFSELHVSSEEEVEEIRSFTEEMVYWWQHALMDTEDWKYKGRLPVKVFGVAMTPNVTIGNSSLDIYVNDEAKCPDACSRFVVEREKYARAPNYSACDQPGEHFDIEIWTGDMGVNASSSGGDWGVRIPWSVFEPEVRGKTQPNVTLHELGHTAGLPDFDEWTALKRPDSIFWESQSPTVFDCMMMRSLWVQHELNPHIVQRLGCESGFKNALATHGCKACALCICEWNGSVPCASYCADTSLLIPTTTPSTTLRKGFVRDEFTALISAADTFAAGSLIALLIASLSW
eukprot:gb/GFBE01078487.1/.p1 GENE.gb/GFBE01078487.1/~~gb/GFBE01078487.1/.p1  ORF type:complete len:391 (+),score=55.20 gb/GFBE01078487.1/:1-1173(+)